jgi:hypothetical protein
MIIMEGEGHIYHFTIGHTQLAITCHNVFHLL